MTVAALRERILRGDYPDGEPLRQDALAEELGVGLDQIAVEHSPPSDELYGVVLLGGIQATGGSTSTRAQWQVLREAGAVAREMLVRAASLRWKVEPGRILQNTLPKGLSATRRSIVLGWKQKQRQVCLKHLNMPMMISRWRNSRVASATAASTKIS